MKERPQASGTRDVRMQTAEVEATSKAAPPAPVAVTQPSWFHELSSSSSSTYNSQRRRSYETRGPYWRRGDTWDDTEPQDRTRWPRPENDEFWRSQSITTGWQQTRSYIDAYVRTVDDAYDRDNYDTWYTGWRPSSRTNADHRTRCMHTEIAVTTCTVRSTQQTLASSERSQITLETFRSFLGFILSHQSFSIVCKLAERPA